MIKILTTIVFVVTVSARDEVPNNCTEWPSKLKPLHECCYIPNHSNGMAQTACLTRCVATAKETKEDCAAECYADMTGIVKDGVLNKPLAKKLYENNAFRDFAWLKVINDGVEKCDYDSNGTLLQNLMKFYNCVDDYLSDNCGNFIHTEECFLTEDHFEKCRNVQPNCTEWPNNLPHPDVCCKPPPLITDALLNKCRFECQRKEFFVIRQAECVHNCTYVETGLRVNGKLDFAGVRRVLSENTNKSEEWEKSIESATINCEKLMKEYESQRMDEQSINIHLIGCITDELSSKCVDFRSGALCNKLKRFMKKCPDVSPRRAQSAYMVSNGK